MKKLYVIIILIVAFLIGIFGGIFGLFKMQNHQISPTNISKEQSNKQNLQPQLPQTILKTTPTSLWKIKTERFTDYDKVYLDVSYKYPSDWIIQPSNQSGHPNYATLFNQDKSSCIIMSFSSFPQIDTNLDNQLSNLGGKPVDSFTTTIDSKPAKFETIVDSDKRFMGAVIDLGADPRYNDMEMYSLLNSCGMSEENIFTSLVESIQRNNK